MRTSDVERKRLPQRQHAPPEFRQRSSTEFQAPFFLRDLAATAEFIRLLAESTFEHGLAGSRIIEVGVGCRPVVHFLPGSYRACVDPLMDQYLALRRDAFDSGVDHFEAVAERLPFADRSFDLCITLNAIDVCRNPRRAVQEFGRVLDTPGYLVIGVNTYPVASRALRVAASAGDIWHGSLSNPRVFSEKSLCSLVEKGFEVVRCVIERGDYPAEQQKAKPRRFLDYLPYRCDKATLFAKKRS